MKNRRDGKKKKTLQEEEDRTLQRVTVTTALFSLYDTAASRRGRCSNDWLAMIGLQALEE